MTILFLALWVALFVAALLLIAAVPTTVVTPNKALLGPLAITGALAGIATLLVAGVLALFGV